MDVHDASQAAVAFLLTYLLHSSLWIALACLWLRGTRALRGERVWKLAILGGVASAGLQSFAPWRPMLGSVALPIVAREQGLERGPAARWPGFDLRSAQIERERPSSAPSASLLAPLEHGASAASGQASSTAQRELLVLRREIERLSRLAADPAALRGIDIAAAGPAWLGSRSPSANGDDARPEPAALLASAAGATAPTNARSERWIAAAREFDLALALFCLWLAGSAVALARAAWSWLRLGFQLRDRRPLVDGALFDEVCAQAPAWRAHGVELSRVRFWIVPSLPVGIGFWWGRHHVCLPERVESELDQGEQRALLAHELAHVARGDSRWLLGLGVLEAVFFFQPLQRWARRELAHLFELGSDELAGRVTRDRLALASCLARVADWVASRRATPMALGMVGMAEHCRSRLGQRLERLLSDELPPPRRASAQVVLAQAGVAIGALAWFMPRVDAHAPTSSASIAALSRGHDALEIATFKGAPSTPDKPAARSPGSANLDWRAGVWSSLARATSSLGAKLWAPRVDSIGPSEPGALASAPAEDDEWLGLLVDLDLALSELQLELAQLQGVMRRRATDACWQERLDEVQRRVVALAASRQRLWALFERRNVHAMEPAQGPAAAAASLLEDQGVTSP